MEVFTLLGCYVVLVGSWCLAFQDSLLVPSSRVQQSSQLLKFGLMGCADTSVSNYQSMPHNIPEQRRLHLHHTRNPKSCIFKGIINFLHPFCLCRHRSFLSCWFILRFSQQWLWASCLGGVWFESWHLLIFRGFSNCLWRMQLSYFIKRETLSTFFQLLSPFILHSAAKW